MSNLNVGKRKSKRIFYFDALRALAILSVIMFHVSKRLSTLIISTYTPTINLQWLFGDFFFAGMIIGVDLFLMLSGALSMGREWTIRSFLGKRIPRIVEPFLFWGFILGIVILLIQIYFPNVLHVIDVFNIQSLGNYFVGIYTSKTFGFGQYWFFWMILGTYLIMPIFNKWLLHSDLKEAEYFLVIWLATCFFTSTINHPLPIKLNYFTGPIGMVVLGYYLRHTKRKIFSNKWFPILLILIGLFCLIYGSFLNSSDHSLFKFDRYSIFNAIEVTGIFLLFRNFSGFTFNSEKLSMVGGVFRKGIFSIAKYSYGFYLIHQAIMDITIKVMQYNHSFIGYGSLFLKLFLITLVISWALMAVLNRIPYVNRVIGAK